MAGCRRAEQRRNGQYSKLGFRLDPPPASGFRPGPAIWVVRGAPDPEPGESWPKQAGSGSWNPGFLGRPRAGAWRFVSAGCRQGSVCFLLGVFALCLALGRPAQPRGGLAWRLYDGAFGRGSCMCFWRYFYGGFAAAGLRGFVGGFFFFEAWRAFGGFLAGCGLRHCAAGAPRGAFFLEA